MSAAKNVDGVPVKIVIINTQYIETDASSFKSVVQRLTGKNSTVAVEEDIVTPLPQHVAASYSGGGHGSNNYWEDRNAGGSGPSLGRLKSFNEFDKLFKESLPPLDDLLRVYADEFQQQQYYNSRNFIDGVWRG